MTVDLVVRGSGSKRSAAEYVTALGDESGHSQVIVYGPDRAAAGGGFKAARDAGALRKLVTGPEETQVLICGGEQMLPVVHQYPIGTVWIALGKGANPVREVWRLRGAHAWLGTKRLGLILEESDGSELDRSTSLAMGRVAKVVALPAEPVAVGAVAHPLEQAAVSSMGPVDDPALLEEDADDFGAGEEVTGLSPAETAVLLAAQEPEILDDPSETDALEAPASEAEESEPAEADSPEATEAEVVNPQITDAVVVNPQITDLTAKPADAAQAAEAFQPVDIPSQATVQVEGGEQTMSEDRMAHGTMLMGEKNPEQALLNRYSLVKERRNLIGRMEQVGEAVQALLKEVFAARFMVNAENAASFEDLTRKLADTAAEYHELSRDFERVEQDLAELSWLKDELEI
jgi:hypothetical protein